MAENIRMAKYLIRRYLLHSYQNMKFPYSNLWLAGLCTDADVDNTDADGNYARRANHDYIR